MRLRLGFHSGEPARAGLMMEWSVARNITLLLLDKLRNRLGLLDGEQIRATTQHYIERSASFLATRA
jgi:ABC-type sugar transport system ATPase subunit